MMKRKAFLLFLICVVCHFYSIAQPKLASIFTDNMVLQQQSNAPIWGWTTPGKTVRVNTSWNHKTETAKADANGRWKAFVATPAAGGPYVITISEGKSVSLKNVLVGEVWLCSGQSNMEMPMKGFKGQPIIGATEAILHSTNNNIRLYTVPRDFSVEPKDNSKPSEWKEAAPEAVSNFSATAYYFGKELYELLHVPIGLINVSYGGTSVETWMDAETLKAFPDIKVPSKSDASISAFRTPTVLYNAMLHPVIGYGVKGMIWYQGESNYDRPDQYETLFPAAVKLWRSQWNEGNFPFYYVQIAPYNYAQLPPYRVGGKYNSAYLRDAQRKALDQIPNAGMAVLMDIGDEATIHPPHKKEVGQRLALLAIADTYQLKGFGAESPSLDTMTITNGIAELKFKNAPSWLTSYGKELAQFEIAGKDKVFYPAKAVIYRSTVKVSSPQVKEPVAVRYAFKDFVTGDLFSTEGIPVSSFRTDNW